MGMLRMLFPFLRWFPMTGATLRADFVAGITVALVLVPQSMAYAQLAGLPVVYGLYASFVPVKSVAYRAGSDAVADVRGRTADVRNTRHR